MDGLMPGGMPPIPMASTPYLSRRASVRTGGEFQLYAEPQQRTQCASATYCDGGYHVPPCIWGGVLALLAALAIPQLPLRETIDD